jgi:hypothetical protein
MCTLSVLFSPEDESCRVMMNRDEKRLRMSGRAPELFEGGGVLALAPVDAQEGGTWIAANEFGLVLALMNVNVGTSCREGRHHTPSRGLVIRSLASARSLDEVSDRFTDQFGHGSPLRPFRLVAASREGVRTLAPGEPVGRTGYLWASSSLGDDLVESPRRALFDRLLATSSDGWSAQDRLHRHAWPDRRHLSVMMSRVDACTVSRTEVVLMRHAVRMTYEPMVDGWPVSSTTMNLPIKMPRAVAA